MTAEFSLLGQEFIALNGGPHFTFNESVSLFISCEDQAEIDYYWNALTADGGSEGCLCDAGNDGHEQVRYFRALLKTSRSP